MMFAIAQDELQQSVDLLESYTVTEETPVALTSVGSWASKIQPHFAIGHFHDYS